MPRTASALATASTAVFLFLILIAGHPNLSSSAQAATATFGMHIVGEPPTFDAGLPVLVAGVWHQVALNLSSTLSTPITLRAMRPAPDPRVPPTRTNGCVTDRTISGPTYDMELFSAPT